MDNSSSPAALRFCLSSREVSLLDCEEIIQPVSQTKPVTLASSEVLGSQSKLWPSQQPLNLAY